MLRNTKSGFGWVAIVIHWVMAIAIFFMFGLGLYMVDLSYYDSWYRGSLELHKSLGMILLLLLLIRLVWKLVNPDPSPFEHDGKLASLERSAAKAAHWVLYLMMGLLMLSGYLISTADGRGIEVFELVTVPSLGEFVQNQEDLAGEIHEYLAWGLIGLVVLHMCAALKHHLLDKDATLKRMLRVVSSKESVNE